MVCTRSRCSACLRGASPGERIPGLDRVSHLTGVGAFPGDSPGSRSRKHPRFRLGFGPIARCTGTVYNECMTTKHGTAATRKNLKAGKSHRESGASHFALLASLALIGGSLVWGQQALSHARSTPTAPVDTYEKARRAFYEARSAADHTAAASLIRKAAQEGNPKAQTALAVLCFEGRGVPCSPQEGVNWLQQAAAQDYAEAENELAVLYAAGKGVEQDWNAALDWCRRAVTHGSKVAAKNLPKINTARQDLTRALAAHNGKMQGNATVQKVSSNGLLVTFEPKKGGLGFAKLPLSESADATQLSGLLAGKGSSDLFTSAN